MCIIVLVLNCVQNHPHHLQNFTVHDTNAHHELNWAIDVILSISVCHQIHI